MNEFDKRAQGYRMAKYYRQLAENAIDAEKREQLRAIADGYQRRARGFGTLKGKNRRGA